MTILNELDSTCGLSDEELTVRFRESIRIDNEPCEWQESKPGTATP